MTQPRSSLFQYLDQQVAKDMAGFYTAFGMPIPVHGDKHMAKK